MRTPDERRRDEPRRAEADTPAPPAHALLRLQRSAGNAAVAALVARQGTGVLEPGQETATPGEAAPIRPTVRFGSRGPAVADVQQRLNVATPPAAPPLVVDGIFGPLTRAAVVHFQSENHLVADGIVGPVTHAALDRASPGPGGPLTPQQEADAVTFNSAVYDTQSVRIIQGQVGITPITGTFDGATAQAVGRFQQRHNLPVTGRVENGELAPMITERAGVLLHDHAIHLVTDFNDLDITTDTLNVHFDAKLVAQPSALRFETGGLRMIRLGPAAFRSPTVLRDEIAKHLATPAPTPGAVGPAPSIIDPTDAAIAALLNENRLGEPRSVMIVQGLLGAQPDGTWSADLAQRVALFQQQSNIPANGLIDENQTFPALGRRLIAAGDNDAVLFLIVDFFDLRDNGNLISVYFDPNIGSGRRPFAFVRREPEQPGSIQVGPNAFAQPFEGLVHVLAHEMEHIRQLTGGPESQRTREFLAHSIGVMAEGIPEEAVEDHDQMANPRPPFGFANNARRTVAEWNGMPQADRVQHRDRFLEDHAKVFDRIRPGTPEATIHAALLDAWNQALAQLPPP